MLKLIFLVTQLRGLRPKREFEHTVKQLVQAENKLTQLDKKGIP